MISLNTVETAYSMLLQEGYIYSAPRSGYYVSRAFVEFSLPEKNPQLNHRHPKPGHPKLVLNMAF